MNLVLFLVHYFLNADTDFQRMFFWAIPSADISQQHSLKLMMINSYRSGEDPDLEFLYMLHSSVNTFFTWLHIGTTSFKEAFFWMCITVFYIPVFCFSPDFWKRKKILFLSLVPVKSFQKTFQRKFLGSVTSWRSKVLRSRQNLPSHLPEWERCPTTSAPCSSGRPAYEACCRSKTCQKSTSPELGHDRGVGGSLCFTAFFWTGSKKLHVMSGNNHFKRWVTAVSKQSGDREKILNNVLPLPEEFLS